MFVKHCVARNYIFKTHFKGFHPEAIIINAPVHSAQPLRY